MKQELQDQIKEAKQSINGKGKSFVPSRQFQTEYEVSPMNQDVL